MNQTANSQYLKVLDGDSISFEILLEAPVHWHIEVGKKAVLHLKIESKRGGKASFSFDVKGFVSVSMNCSASSEECCVKTIDLHEEATYQERFVATSQLAHHKLQAFLLGEGATIQLKSLALVSSGARFDESIKIVQTAPKSRSFVLHKAVVLEGGLSSYHSVGSLHAKENVSHAFVHHLTLGRHAHIRAKPTFEIFHDDVEAFHGCTSKEIDEEFLIYARSRGVAEPHARKLFMEGFCSEILDGQSFPSFTIDS